MLNKLFYFLLVFLSVNVSYAQRKLALVTNGSSKFQIVIPTNANAIEKQSAAVLQDYLQQISTVKIPIVQKKSSSTANQIIIGRNQIVSQREIEDLGGDGFIIRKVNNSLIFEGGNRKGTLYAVYAFLEDYLGCRMYTAKVVDIPKTGTISLPAKINKKQVPTFNYRMTFFPDAFDKTYCDFHKMNVYLEDWGLWVHSFDQLVPKEKYFQSHPEYFALVNGKRNPAQLCLTNPDVVNIVVQKLQEMMRAKPDSKSWSVSQNDNDNFCECENCKRLNDQQESYQGSLLPFVNSVAKHLPDKTISTLAYRKSEKPPKTIRPLSNVLIMLCTSYDERRIPQKDQTTFSFYRNFKIWAALTPKLFIWDYIVQFANSLSPFPDFYTIQPNVQFFAKGGGTEIFLEGIGNQPGEFSELRCYLSSRLMWNKDADVKATMDEFTRGYYGKKGGKYVSDYINLLDRNASAKRVGLRSGGTPLDALHAYLSPDNITTYKSIFTDALAATTGTVYHDRILKEYLPVLYAELEIDKSMIGAGKINFINRQTNSKLLDDFYNISKQLNIIYLNEARLTIDNYYKNYNNLLNNMKQ